MAKLKMYNIDEVQSLEIPTSTNGGLDETTQLVTRAVPRIPLPPCCLLHVTTMNCYLSLYMCGMQGSGNPTAGSLVFILPVMCN